MTRLNFTADTKRKAHERSGGICECHRIPWLKRPDGCGVLLGNANTFYEHINPDAIRQDNSLDNCAVLVRTCWREKTDRYDRPVIAHSNRTRDRAWGIRQRSTIPGGRDDPRKRTMRGEVVSRATGERWGFRK